MYVNTSIVIKQANFVSCTPKISYVLGCMCIDHRDWKDLTWCTYVYSIVNCAYTPCCSCLEGDGRQNNQLDFVFLGQINAHYYSGISTKFHFLVFFWAMDTFFGLYFHFYLELALETWAKGSFINSLGVHDFAHSLASFQLLGLSNQWMFLLSKTCLQCQSGSS